MPEQPADRPEEETPDVIAHSAEYDEETPCVTATCTMLLEP
jgi:hypothetical protein